MEDDNQKQLLDYRPVGRRQLEETLKRLLDGYTREPETGRLLDKLTDQKKTRRRENFLHVRQWYTRQPCTHHDPNDTHTHTHTQRHILRKNGK